MGGKSRYRSLFGRHWCHKPATHIEVFAVDAQASDLLNAEAQAIAAVDALVVDPDAQFVELLGYMLAEDAFEQQ